MTSFFGTQTHAIDVKGRLSVPAGMRRAAGRGEQVDEFVLVAAFEGCLALYSQEEWDRLEQRLRRIPVGDLEGRAFARGFLHGAVKVTVDAQGRITLPPALIARAGLGKEAVLHGVLDRIEIWSPERHRASIEESLIKQVANADRYLGWEPKENQG